MSRPSVLSVEDKFRLVVAVVSGELSVAEAARRSQVSEQSISNWKRQFLDSGKRRPPATVHRGCAVFTSCRSKNFRLSRRELVVC